MSEAQLQLLIGMGRDPLTGQPLGRAYPVYKGLDERVAERVKTLDSNLSLQEKAAAITQIETEEAGKPPRRAVAGFDFTFSIPKSASVLWAVADARTQQIIADAHHAAVAEMLAYMEREVAATRTGATEGDGAVAQVDVRGLIATAYDHFDSRAGDPHLHTHVVISNKVQTVLDGKWRSLDSRPMHAATVAISEMHEAVFADHLTRALGVEWETRDRGKYRNPALAISSVPESLTVELSSRSRIIDEEKDRLTADYVAAHGHQPTARTIIRLRAQATLSTRPAKTLQSLSELTAGWRARASKILGADATAWAAGATEAEPPLLLRADDVPLDVVESIAARVVAAACLLRGRKVLLCTLSSDSSTTLREPYSHERYQRDRPVDQELERVPDAHEHHDVEPLRHPAVDKHTHERGEVDVDDCKQHRWDAPLEATASAELVEHDVRRHEPAHESADVKAGDPDVAKHGNSPLLSGGDR